MEGLGRFEKVRATSADYIEDTFLNDGEASGHVWYTPEHCLLMLLKMGVASRMARGEYKSR